MSESLKKSGFVVLAGRSNVGKSTLLNSLVGSKVAIVTPKPQTTRHPVRGIFNDERGQIVFVDTPGIFLGKRDHVSKRLNDIVKEQLDGIEAIVYVVDPTRASGPEEEHIQGILKQLSIPIILVINKVDLTPQQRPAMEEAAAIQVGQQVTLEVSALTGDGLENLVDSLFSLIPDGEAFYPEHQLTDVDNKKWLEELIREKIFLHLHQELPYSIKVEVTDDEVKANNVRHINGKIWTTEDRYKGMIIGAKGSMLKQIGMSTRKELELATDQKVFLELHVAVDPKWPERFV